MVVRSRLLKARLTKYDGSEELRIRILGPLVVDGLSFFIVTFSELFEEVNFAAHGKIEQLVTVTFNPGLGLIHL